MYIYNIASFKKKNLIFTNVGGDGVEQSWAVSSVHDAWINGESAGGCRNFIDTFHLNPQFTITIDETVDHHDEDDDEGGEGGGDSCTVIISLMQKNRRARRNEGLGYLSIGFVVYRIKPGQEVQGPMDQSFFKYNLSVARSKSFINMREVSARLSLEAGTYLIIPSTYDAGYEAEFLLRTFSETPAVVEKK